MKKESVAQAEKPLKWWQLSLLGVACTIGTGFFLGSAIAINLAGPIVVLSFAIAAIGTYCVFEALAKLTIADPQQGSFRSYAKNAYGRWAGFSSGWMYFFSEMLIIGSQMTALSIFTKFWLPDVPLWIFATCYAILGLLVILAGSKSFDRVENILAVMKIAAILMFIILAVLALFGLFGEGTTQPTVPRTYNTILPNGLTALLPSLIFGFYGFGGIEIMGLLAVRLENKADATKSGKVMLFVLGVIYVVSVGLALIIVPTNRFTTDESPFVTALNNFNIPYIEHIFNGVFIIAGFSTMVASLFAVIRILVTLAKDKDAPMVLAKKIKNKVALPAMALTAFGITVSIVLSILMPDRIYEYITTAAGLMLLYNWFFILGSYKRLLPLTKMETFKTILGFVLIFITVTGTLFHQTSRPGFLVSLAFLVVIAIITLIMRHFWKNSKNDSNKPPSIFTKLE